MKKNYDPCRNVRSISKLLGKREIIGKWVDAMFPDAKGTSKLFVGKIMKWFLSDEAVSGSSFVSPGA